MLKNLIVNLPTDAGGNATADYAISFAREFDSHLAAVAFACEVVPIAMLGEEVSPDIIDELQQEAEKVAKAAVSKFEEATRGSGISAEVRWMNASFAEAGDLLGRMGRRFDLSIVRQPEPDKNTPDHVIADAVLFDSSRPVLMVPYILKGGVKLDRILMGWDGSRSAARAVGDSLPFLKRAKAVEIVVVGDKVKSKEIPGRIIGHSLARHGVKVEVREIVATGIDAANVLLSHAAD